jgi:hypothetical protein
MAAVVWSELLTFKLRDRVDTDALPGIAEKANCRRDPGRLNIGGEMDVIGYSRTSRADLATFGRALRPSPFRRQRPFLAVG